MANSGRSAPSLSVTLLGTGTSTGVPVIGCPCEVCQSSDPRDKRTRTSCLVQVGSVHILIDTGPDLRRQALRENLRRVDAVLFTHHHFDHIAGIDDLRPFFFDNGQFIPCYARPNTAQVLRNMYPYIFGADRYPSAARLDLEEVHSPFEVPSRYDDGAPPVPVEPIEAYHGDLPLYGYRIGRFAYLTDISRIPDAGYERLHDIDVLVLDALRREPHPTHFSFDEAVAAARQVGARQTYFVHMTHSVLHAEEEDRLPDDIALAYDGLSFQVDC